MNRLRPTDFQPRPAALRPEHLTAGRGDAPVSALIITCTEDCFDPAILARELAPATWLVHRTPGNVVPPHGTGHHAEENLLEWAVGELQIDTLVVCGHHPCGVARHLLTPDAPADDFVLREWLSHAEAARRCVLGLSGADVLRSAAAHNVRAQLANLGTHPAVAAALAAGSLNLWGWLHAGELFCPGSSPTCFDRRVAVQPEQNRHLRRERLRPGRPLALPSIHPPYLA